MGLGRLAEARQRMLLFKGTVADSVAGHHLRGAVNTALARTPADYVAAATDFQSAYKAQHNWDSLYGETLSLLRGGRQSLVRLNFTRLKNEARSKAEKNWLVYLEIEMMLARHEHPEAFKKLSALEASDPQPDSFIRTRLMANIYAGMGERGKTEDYESKLMDLTRKGSYYSSIDGLTSPIGPFALMPR